jgi:hypothetical protein
VKQLGDRGVDSARVYTERCYDSIHVAREIVSLISSTCTSEVRLWFHQGRMNDRTAPEGEGERERKTLRGHVNWDRLLPGWRKPVPVYLPTEEGESESNCTATGDLDKASSHRGDGRKSSVIHKRHSETAPSPPYGVTRGGMIVDTVGTCIMYVFEVCMQQVSRGGDG